VTLSLSHILSPFLDRLVVSPLLSFFFVWSHIYITEHLSLYVHPYVFKYVYVSVRIIYLLLRTLEQGVMRE